MKSSRTHLPAKPKVNTTLRLDAALRNRLAAAATDQRVSMNEIIESLLNRELPE